MSREQNTSDTPQTDGLRAVLWDMDGTLIDTEPYWLAEETALVTDAGGSWTLEDGMALVGSDLLQAARHILATTRVIGTPEQVVDRLLGGVVRRCRHELPWRPGARELVRKLSEAGVPQALVTMSWAPLAQVLLEALPPETFAAVVTGDQVRRGKPNPEPYQEAASRLGLPVADCLAVEDSPTGVASASAAGVATLAVPHLVPIPTAPGVVQRDSLTGVDLAELGRIRLKGRKSYSSVST